MTDPRFAADSQFITPRRARRCFTGSGSFHTIPVMSGTSVHTPSKPSTRSRPVVSTPTRKPRRQPPYHVILWDDDDHTYEYVIEMLGSLFGHRSEQAFQFAKEVDTSGRSVIDTTTKERAELKRDQIGAYGADWRIPRCKGAMSATIEPAPDPG